jgi:flagellar protein FliT
MHGHPVLTLYESVAETTTQMLAAARAKDWVRLAELEAACAEYTRLIVEQSAVSPLSERELKRKLASIKKILADDREIRELSEPWMARLSGMLRGKAY